MALITLRRIKGSMLTHDEVDDNFQHLNTDLIAVQGDVTIINGQLIPHYIRDGGDDVTGIGWRALANSLPGGLSNTALGTDAGGALTSGDNNVALGAQALASLTSGLANTALGDHALRYATGSSNIGLGQLAASGVSAFDQCILIGNATVPLVNSLNAIVIANAMTSLGTNTALIGNNFNVLVRLNGVIQGKLYTVALLPDPATLGLTPAVDGKGARAFVTDATLAYGSAPPGTIVAGGGSNLVPVYSDGSNWLYEGGAGSAGSVALTAKQIGYGSAGNLLIGSPDLQYDPALGYMTVAKSITGLMRQTFQNTSASASAASAIWLLNDVNSVLAFSKASSVYSAIGLGGPNVGSISNNGGALVFTNSDPTDFIWSRNGGGIAQEVMRLGPGTLSLGLAGQAVGAVKLSNLTNGSITVQPQTGALGANVLTAPAKTGTLAINPMTTAGDLVIGGSAGLETRLAPGNPGDVLSSPGPAWSASASGNLRWRDVVNPASTYAINDVVRQNRHSWVATANGVGAAANFVQMDKPGRIQLLIVSGFVDWNMLLEEAGYLVMTANAVMNIPTNVNPGEYYKLLVEQGTAGGWTLGWNSSCFRWPGDVAPTLTATANKIDIFDFVADGTGHLYGYAHQNYSP